MGFSGRRLKWVLTVRWVLGLVYYSPNFTASQLRVEFSGYDAGKLEGESCVCKPVYGELITIRATM